MGFSNLLGRSSVNNFCLKDMHRIPNEVLGTMLARRNNLFFKKIASKRLTITASCFYFTVTFTEVDTAHINVSTAHL